MPRDKRKSNRGKRQPVAEQAPDFALASSLVPRLVEEDDAFDFGEDVEPIDPGTGSEHLHQPAFPDCNSGRGYNPQDIPFEAIAQLETNPMARNGESRSGCVIESIEGISENVLGLSCPRRPRRSAESGGAQLRMRAERQTIMAYFRKEFPEQEILEQVDVSEEENALFPQHIGDIARVSRPKGAQVQVFQVNSHDAETCILPGRCMPAPAPSSSGAGSLYRPDSFLVPILKRAFRSEAALLSCCEAMLTSNQSSQGDVMFAPKAIPAIDEELPSQMPEALVSDSVHFFTGNKTHRRVSPPHAILHAFTNRADFLSTLTSATHILIPAEEEPIEKTGTSEISAGKIAPYFMGRENSGALLRNICRDMLSNSQSNRTRTAEQHCPDLEWNALDDIKHRLNVDDRAVTLDALQFRVDADMNRNDVPKLVRLPENRNLCIRKNMPESSQRNSKQAILERLIKADKEQMYSQLGLRRAVIAREHVYLDWTLSTLPPAGRGGANSVPFTSEMLYLLKVTRVRGTKKSSETSRKVAKYLSQSIDCWTLGPEKETARKFHPEAPTLQKCSRPGARKRKNQNCAGGGGARGNTTKPNAPIMMGNTNEQRSKSATPFHSGAIQQRISPVQRVVHLSRPLRGLLDSIIEDAATCLNQTPDSDSLGEDPLHLSKSLLNSISKMISKRVNLQKRGKGNYLQSIKYLTTCFVLLQTALSLAAYGVRVSHLYLQHNLNRYMFMHAMCSSSSVDLKNAFSHLDKDKSYDHPSLSALKECLGEVSGGSKVLLIADRRAHFATFSTICAMGLRPCQLDRLLEDKKTTDKKTQGSDSGAPTTTTSSRPCQAHEVQEILTVYDCLLSTEDRLLNIQDFPFKRFKYIVEITDGDTDDNADKSKVKFGHLLDEGTSYFIIQNDLPADAVIVPTKNNLKHLTTQAKNAEKKPDAFAAQQEPNVPIQKQHRKFGTNNDIDRADDIGQERNPEMFAPRRDHQERQPANPQMSHEREFCQFPVPSGIAEDLKGPMQKIQFVGGGDDMHGRDRYEDFQRHPLHDPRNGVGSPIFHADASNPTQMMHHGQYVQHMNVNNSYIPQDARGVGFYQVNRNGNEGGELFEDFNVGNENVHATGNIPGAGAGSGLIDDDIGGFELDEEDVTCYQGGAVISGFDDGAAVTMHANHYVTGANTHGYGLEEGTPHHHPHHYAPFPPPPPHQPFSQTYCGQQQQVPYDGYEAINSTFQHHPAGRMSSWDRILGTQAGLGGNQRNAYISAAPTPRPFFSPVQAPAHSHSWDSFNILAQHRQISAARYAPSKKRARFFF